MFTIAGLYDIYLKSRIDLYYIILAFLFFFVKNCDLSLDESLGKK